MTLQIPAAIRDEMVAHAREELPCESVGMLLGTNQGEVKVYLRLVNELKSPTRFLTEARSMLNAEKKRRELGLEVLAIVHSHPTSEPVPSQYDRADHYSGEVMSVIISLVNEKPLVRGWWIRGEVVEEGQVGT